MGNLRLEIPSPLTGRLFIGNNVLLEFQLDACTFRVSGGGDPRMLTDVAVIAVGPFSESAVVRVTECSIPGTGSGL